MKPSTFLFSLLTVLFLTACSTTPSPALTTPQTTSGTSQTISGIQQASTYTYTRTMQKPDLSEMTNRTAINEGFHQQRTTGYLLSAENVTYLQQCLQPQTWDTEPRGANIITNGMPPRELTAAELFSGNVIQITGTRNADNLLNLPKSAKEQLAQRGRTIVDYTTFNNFSPSEYSKASSNAIGGQEERAIFMQKLGGQSDENARYPFNTVLITNDVLLHVFHKLFDNGLKYYEETIARPTLTSLSEKLYTYYRNLAQQEQDTSLKSTYEFLTTYRAIPHIFLPENQDLIDQRTAYQQEHHLYAESDFSDEQIYSFIRQRAKDIAPTLASRYQALSLEIVEKILNANEANTDLFLSTLDAAFFESTQIKQDYTQFKPRAHYTDSSLLKTYFMAMKWLMREKFYFGSRPLANAAMILASTIPTEDLTELNKLSQQIFNLIGTDDDLTLEGMRSFVQRHFGLNQPTSISTAPDNIINELRTLQPQKIQSTAYQTDAPQSTTEEAAKQMTDGFIFFGEKFTLDSYIFDLMTAGSAEQEFTFKPNIQTALMIPDILEDSTVANQLVHLRLTEKQQLNQVLEMEGKTQLSSYEKMKQEASTKIDELLQTTTTPVMNVYHKWLQMLGRLLKTPLENAPYFRRDPVYALKNLITYMGSYTELKHDTLLYVKQSYAEMGGGGEGCSIYVENPALPVPKGYVEAEPDFIDQLIKLNAETLPYFDETYEQEKFIAFGQMLERLKSISIQQMHNKVISDEEFEWLRLLATQGNQGTIPLLLQPTKLLGMPSQKEMRGALIADIFTSEGGNPLYEATGRPALMLLMVNDINGARVVIGPVFTHYEFYQADKLVQGDEGSRYTDEDWQDFLHQETPHYEKGILQQAPNRSDQGLSIVSRELKKALEKAE